MMHSLSLRFVSRACRRGFVAGVLGLLLSLSGCASAPKAASAVEPGMARSDVKRLLGEPKDRTFRGSQELWVYDGEKGRNKLVVFENNRVVEMLNADAKDSVMHDVSKTDPQGPRENACVGSNNYGKFTEGGGCNMYGCYPAGGYCNGFGCSSTGRCTAQGCPSKIDSHKCRD